MTIRFDVVVDEATGRTLLADPVTGATQGECHFESSEADENEVVTVTLTFEPPIAEMIRRQEGPLNWNWTARGTGQQCIELTFVGTGDQIQP